MSADRRARGWTCFHREPPAVGGAAGGGPGGEAGRQVEGQGAAEVGGLFQKGVSGHLGGQEGRRAGEDGAGVSASWSRDFVFF